MLNDLPGSFSGDLLSASGTEIEKYLPIDFL